MLLTTKDVNTLYKLFRDLDKYIGIRVKKIKENSRNYLMKNGLDINEILSSRFIPGRIATEIKKQADLDFHIEGIIGDFVINLFLFNNNDVRASSEQSLSQFRSSEEDEFGSTFVLSRSRSVKSETTLSSYLTGSESYEEEETIGTETKGTESIGTLGGAKVGKRKQFKALNLQTFKTLQVSEGIYGEDIVNMLIDGLTFCLSCKTARRQYSVILYPSTRLKELPSVKRYEDEYIQEHNINSGMTIVNLNASKKSISAVVRREEMAKVFLHEIIHATLVDVNSFGYYSSDLVSLEQKIRKDLRISQATPLAIGEAATEALAEQVYLTLLSFRLPVALTGGDKRNMKAFTSYLYTLVAREIKFCRLQILKILYFYGFRTVNEFLRATKSSRSMPKLASPTNVFGYMFMRYGLLEMFMETVRKVIQRQEEESIYNMVKRDIQLVPRLYRESYKRLIKLLKDEGGSYIADVLRPLEDEFPDIYELSLRFLSCEGLSCWRGL